MTQAQAQTVTARNSQSQSWNRSLSRLSIAKIIYHGSSSLYFLQRG
mgnify:CR=1 FL=1